MEKMAKSSGNTIPRVIPSKYWCFTDYQYDLAKWQATLSKYDIQYIIGEETCPTTNRKHLQGYIEAKKIIRPNETFKELPGVHWEKRRGTREHNITYCSKENNFITNFKIKKKTKIIKMEELILNDWMREITSFIETNENPRLIYWIVDIEGGKGKTRFCRYLFENYSNVVYFTGGKANDITSQLLEIEYDPELCLFDLPRNNEGYISYNAIEQIKNGMINSSKYKGGTKIFNPPQLLVFSNFEPDKTNLSKDRWIIKEI